MKTFREKFSAISEVIGDLPQDYYTLTVRSDVMVSKAKSMLHRRASRRPWKLNHQHDVASHERCLIRRGPLPLQNKLLKRLKKRGYEVYVSSALSVEDASRLEKRGVPAKREDEWLAIHTTQVCSHRKGPEDSPYVPAMRRFLGGC